MEVTEQMFQKLSIHLHLNVVASQKSERNVWIVSASICALQYIKINLYHTSGETQEMRYVRNVPNTSLGFHQTSSSDETTHFLSHQNYGHSSYTTHNCRREIELRFQ